MPSRSRWRSIVHRDNALLYASGETNAEETAPFESHLPDCPDCLKRISLTRAVSRSAKIVLETPSKEVFAHAVQLDGGLGGTVLPKWFRLLLTAAAISTAFWWVQKVQNQKPDSEPAAAVQERNNLSMPKKPARKVGDSNLGRRRRSSSNSLKSMKSMPERPVDCSDRSSILTFKRYAWSEFGGGQPHGIYTADRWASCICRNATAAGRPKPPSRKSNGRSAPACPPFMVGPVAQEQRDIFAASFLKAAKSFHRDLPISREQAAKLTSCLCGAIPKVER